MLRLWTAHQAQALAEGLYISISTRVAGIGQSPTLVNTATNIPEQGTEDKSHIACSYCAATTVQIVVLDWLDVGWW